MYQSRHSHLHSSLPISPAADHPSLSTLSSDIAVFFKSLPCTFAVSQWDIGVDSQKRDQVIITKLQVESLGTMKQYRLKLYVSNTLL